MIERTVVAYPSPSLVEHLMVFAIVFVAGSLWATCIRWYVGYRMEAKDRE